jgi:hypothetical protein
MFSRIQENLVNISRRVADTVIEQVKAFPDYVEGGDKAGRLKISFADLTRQHGEALVASFGQLKDAGFIAKDSTFVWDDKTRKLTLTSKSLIHDICLMQGFAMGAARGMFVASPHVNSRN